MGKTPVSRGQTRIAFEQSRIVVALIVFFLAVIACLAAAITFAAGAIWLGLDWGPGPAFRNVFGFVLVAASAWVVIIFLANAPSKPAG